MHNALWKGIEQPVHAEEVLLATHSESVKNVSFFFDIKCSFFIIVIIIVAGCKADDECPLTEACYDRECRDPCLFQECGANAICTPRLHQAFCRCQEGYRGNPYDQCRQYECLIDSDCRDTLKCENEKCVDPCACAQFADCTPRNHRGICTCFPDYTGNPYGIACDPSKEFVNIYLIFNSLLFFYQSQSQLLRSQGALLMAIVLANRLVSMVNAWIHVCISNLVFKMLNVQSKMSYLFESWCALANQVTLGKEMRDVTW